MTTDRRFQNVHAIINPGAGQPRPILHAFNQVFRRYETAWSVSITHQGGDAERYTREAVEGGADLIVACGGDGTVMEVANGMVHGSVPLMIVPCGTNNVLAAEFNVPDDIETALAQIFVREPRYVDVGQVGERYFLMRAEIGLSGTANEATTRELKNALGAMAYLMGAAIASETNARRRFRLSLDGEDFDVEGLICNIANTRLLGSKTDISFPGATPHDGLLDVFVFDTRPHILVATISRFLNLHHRSVTGPWQAREIRVLTDTPETVWCDGEPFASTPTTIRVVPDAIQIMCLAESV